MLAWCCRVVEGKHCKGNVFVYRLLERCQLIIADDYSLGWNRGYCGRLCRSLSKEG